MDNFKKLFDSIPHQRKEEYLFRLLSGNESLKGDFLEEFKELMETIRLQGKEVFDPEQMMKQVIQEADQLKKELGELDLEILDWDSYKYPHHYVPEYEVAEELAEQEADTVFRNYGKALERVCKHGNMTDITMKTMAIFHGSFTADINDPYYSLGDPPFEYFVQTTNDILAKHLGKAKSRQFSDEDFQESFNFLFYFISVHYSNETVFLQLLSEFLKMVITDKTTARFAWNAIEKYQTGTETDPVIMEHITHRLGDETLWLHCLENSFLKNYETSVKLLDHYYAQNDSVFDIKAEQFSDQYGNMATNYLADKVRKGTPLYLRLIKDKTNMTGDIKYFKEFREFAGKEEIDEFIRSVRNDNLRAKIYKHEKMFDELEKMIRDIISSRFSFDSFDFETAVSGLFRDRPQVAWELIVEEINRYMKVNRKRETYRYVARLLGSARKIPGKSEKVRESILFLYNAQPRLPALRDEFKKAGIV